MTPRANSAPPVSLESVLAADLGAADLPTDDSSAIGFASLGLDDRVLDSLIALGYEEPTPIQRAAIPALLTGGDVLAQAATGTGKTAAFALPLLHRLSPDAPARARTAALILVPTRELAMQVAEAVHRYGKALHVVALPVYGGAPMETQIRALKRGVDVVVATPGRALDHIRRGTLTLESVRTVVLDEADEMLDMGFAEDLEAILESTPAERQTALFSATLPPRIASIAAKHLRDPETIKIDREPVAAGKAAKVRQVAYIVPRAHKMAALGRVLDIEHPTSAIVFCRTRTEVDELTETLNARGYRAEALHGGMSQDQRDRVMKKFRANKTDLLVATDVAARGLDVQHVSHVVNYDVPSASESYVHRIGRTGRAGREGVAITLAEPREHRLLRNIEFLTKSKIEIAQVPTVADLRARRLELTRASIRESLLGGELDACRVIVESLAEEFDLMDVAAAAVKLLEARDGTPDEEEIPTAPPRRERPGREERDAREPRGSRSARGAAREWESAGERGSEGFTRERRPATHRPTRGDDEHAPTRDRSAKRREADGATYERPARDERAPRRPAAGERESTFGPPRRKTRSAGPTWDVARLYIGAGRTAKVRPGDLVGAIANEAGIDSRAIGAIQISDRFSIVEVPDEVADDVVDALRSSTIKGRKVLVRRDRA